VNHTTPAGDFKISPPVETSWIKYLDPDDRLSPLNRRALENLGYGFLIFRDTWLDPTGPGSFHLDTVIWALRTASSVSVWPCDLPCNRDAVAWEIRKLACCDFSSSTVVILTSAGHWADWLALARRWRRKGVPILHPRVTTEIDQ
jgi:hypothetical protein